MWRLFVLLVRSTSSGRCDPGATVFAPFPAIGGIVQATVISQIIDGTFIVQWYGSPDLCTDPSARSKCIVDAAQAYNMEGLLCAMPTTSPLPSTALSLRQNVNDGTGSYAAPTMSVGTAIGITLGCLLVMGLLFAVIALLARKVLLEPDPVFEGPAVELRLQKFRKNMVRLPPPISNLKSTSSLKLSVES